MNQLTLILRLAVAALELWVARELRSEERELFKDELEIERLRGLGDPASQLAADRLRQRIIRARGVVGRIERALPAPGAETASGESCSYQGRDIHSGSG